MEKEERTECVFLHVTPKVKKELEEVKDNDSLKEKIVRDFFTSETEWLKESLKEMDESIIKYKASLIKIKDSFGEANNAYSDEISKLYDIVWKENIKLQEQLVKPKEEIDNMTENVKVITVALEKLSSSVNYGKLENLEWALNLAERIKNFPDDTKEILSKIINK